MSKVEDRLWSDLIREHGAELGLASWRAPTGEHAVRRYGAVGRRSAAVGALAGAAGAAAIVLFAVGLGDGAPKAFAGWSASPTTPAEGQIASAQTACANAASSLVSGMKDGRTEIPSTMRGSFSEIGAGEWQTTLSDTRGRYTMMILQAGNGGLATACRASIGAPSPFVMMESGGAATAPPAPGEVRVLTDAESTGQGAGDGAESAPFTVVDGEVGSGVTALTLTLKDGTQVQASVEKGWFLVWWPGSQADLLTEKVTTATDGTTSTQALNYP